MKTLFFDTYAFFEILNKNPAYSEFITDTAVMTTKLNLMELYYGILKDYGKESAGIAFQRFLEFVVDIDDETIKEAMMFKLHHKARKISYIDAIGYMAAMRKNVKFLTGDIQFKDMNNVEFVK
ncbi:MAG: PIN domain-containing protein [Candidatus Aenigmarchaeota archaeon]|nr:PIN domain-containing protein [Candidatus Aenigmarchaeota archaeon]